MILHKTKYIVDIGMANAYHPISLQLSQTFVLLNIWKLFLAPAPQFSND